MMINMRRKTIVFGEIRTNVFATSQSMILCLFFKQRLGDHSLIKYFTHTGIGVYIREIIISLNHVGSIRSIRHFVFRGPNINPACSIRNVNGIFRPK